MGHYVYRYMHPDYPWLYVGKTDASLANRIRTHDTCKDDNISREYLPLLEESVVLYIELQNSVQTTYVEKMLIDKYKPFLNKMDKVDGECEIKFSLPRWKKFIRKLDISEKPVKGSVSSKSIKEDIEDATEKLAQAEFELSGICDSIVQTKRITNKILQKRDSIYPITPNKELYKVSITELEDFYRKYPDSKECFFSYGNNAFGEPVSINVDRYGIWISHDGEESDKMKLPTIGAHSMYALAENLGGIFPSSIAGYIMLKQIYETRYTKMITGLRSVELKDVDNIKVSNDKIFIIGYDGDDEYEVFSVPSSEKCIAVFKINKNRKNTVYLGENDDSFNLEEAEKEFDKLRTNKNIKWYKSNIPGMSNFPYLSSRKKVLEAIDGLNNSISMLWG